MYGLGLIAKTDSQDGQLYYLADGLASTTGLTDGEGSVVGTYTYDVFGAIRSETGGQANDYRFTGQQLDVASDLYYLRARYYDPAIGRFLTRDPFCGWFASPQSQNPYAYVMNSPALYADPMGLAPWDDAWECVQNPLDCVKGAADDAADAAGGFLTSPWAIPVLCNPMTGPAGCAAALGVNAPVTATIEWGLNTFSKCDPSKEGKEVGRWNCGGLAGAVHWALGSPPGYTVGDTIFLWDPAGPRTVRHEQGHLPQYDWLGDYFWPAYGFGLVTGAAACVGEIGPGFFDCAHDRSFMEWWADR